MVCSVYVQLEQQNGAWLIIHAGGFIHFFFEGYFAYNFRHMGGMQDLFGQLWKEYSLSDSRYLTQDAFVLCMETITAVRFRLFSCRTTKWLYANPITSGLLGSSLLLNCHAHRDRSPTPLPTPDHRFPWSALRRRVILCDQHV